MIPQVLALFLFAVCALAQPILIDPGGPTDPGAAGQSATYTVPAALMPVGILPPGTNDATMRYGDQFTYHVPVPNAGLYRVTLYFQEPIVQQAGGRVFSVTANDAPILSDLDLVATAGYLVPTARSAFVSVAGTDLALAFTAQFRSRNRTGNWIGYGAVVSLIVVEPFAVVQLAMPPS